MVFFNVFLKLLVLVLFVFVKFNVVLWFIDVWMKGNFSVIFIEVLKFLYFSMGKFWLWYIVSIMLVFFRYLGWNMVFVGRGFVIFKFFFFSLLSVGMMVWIFLVLMWLFLFVWGFKLYI